MLFVKAKTGPVKCRQSYLAARNSRGKNSTSGIQLLILQKEKSTAGAEISAGFCLCIYSSVCMHVFICMCTHSVCFMAFGRVGFQCNR